MKTILFYGVFWTFACLISMVVGRIGQLVRLFNSLMVYGEGDPQLMAGLISETMVTWLLKLIFFTIVIYPIYALFRRKTSFLWLLLTIAFVFATAVYGLFSEKFDILITLFNFAGLGVFSLVAVELPYRIRARKKDARNLAQESAVFD